MGQEVNEVFAATTLQLRAYSNGEFLSMRLADKTGKISAVYWSGTQELLTRLQHAPLIRVKGRVKEYQGSAQITVQEVAPVGPDEPIDESDFLPVSPIEPERMIESLQEWKASLSTEYHRRCGTCSSRTARVSTVSPAPPAANCGTTLIWRDCWNTPSR
jgi:RecG-like helicase